MKTVLSLVLLAALATVAHAEDAKVDKPEPKGLETTSPWSVNTTDKSDGYFGASSTTITRDIGDGWSVGARVSARYRRVFGGASVRWHLDDSSLEPLLGPMPRSQLSAQAGVIVVSRSLPSGCLTIFRIPSPPRLDAPPPRGPAAARPRS